MQIHIYHVAWTQMVMAIVTCLAKSTDDPVGHLKPLGSHRRFQGGIAAIGKFPAPWTFYDNFLKESRPLIMRGVLEEGDIPAYHMWSDEYLREKYGELDIDVEEGKKEDRVKSLLSAMKLGQFLDTYESEDKYLVTDIPSAMKGDVKVPLTLQCGGFQDRLAKVIMWFSSGGTKSHLHCDSLDNINCLLDGRKDIFMVDKKYKDRIQADGWIFNGGFSSVDVEKVDMYKFPKLRKVPWYNITLNKGDCLYIPYGWFHQVNSANGRNFALNFWFTHLLWYNKTDCEDIDAYNTPSISLKNFKMLQNGFENQESIRFDVFEKFERKGYETVSREDFYSDLIDDGNDATQKVLDECFDFIDEDKDGKLSWKEIQFFDMQKIQNKYFELLEEIDNSASRSEVEDEGEEEKDNVEERIDTDDKASPVEVDDKEDVKEEILLKDNQLNEDELNKKEYIHEEL